MTPTSPAPTPVPSTIERIAAYMGWTEAGPAAFYLCPDRPQHSQTAFPFSNLNDAFLIVERMRRDGWTFRLEMSSYRYHARFLKYRHDDECIGIESDDQPAAAICAAAAAALASSGAAAGRAKGGAE